MPIQIVEGADPLSDAALRSGSESIVRNAQSDACRMLKLELLRYCRGEVNGRSFLVAGHRGAGKTMMVADAVDKVLRASRRSGEQLLRPLPIFLHGPSLFEAEAEPVDAIAAAKGGAARRRLRREAPPPEGPNTEAQRVALKQIILCLHRAVSKEFVRAYRQRLVEGPGPAQPSSLPPEDLAELAAHFEIELTEDPSAARLHEFWTMAGTRQSGVLFDFPQRLDQGPRELVALNGMCNAHQRISGEISAQDKSARSEDVASESQSGLELRGAELVKPLASVVAGAAVAGGAAAGSHSLVLAMIVGILTALGSTLFFKASTTTNRRTGRQLDTTFIPDLSVKTLDRILPTLIQRLRDCGLAPVLIVDELDKVSNLAERFVPMMDFMKKLVAENVFSCFVTDRSYLETLRVRNLGTAHGRASSYFTHSLLVTFRPADIDAYLDRLLQVDRPPAAPMPDVAPGSTGAPDVGFQASMPGVDVEVIDLEVLKWVLRHRSRLHALGLAREIAALRGESGALHIAPGAVRTEYTSRIDVTFQVAVEFQLAQAHVQAWLRQRPGMTQTLLDALYYPTREWLNGGAMLAPHAVRAHFYETLILRMNLDEATSAGAAVSMAGALSDDDKSFLWTMMEDVLRFLCDATDVTDVASRWGKLPAREWSPRAEPGLAVRQAMLLGDVSLVVREPTPAGDNYVWRYFPTGESRVPAVVAVHPSAGLPAGAVRDPAAVATAAPAAAPGAPPGIPQFAAALAAAGTPRAVLDPDIIATMEHILAIERNLWPLFRQHGESQTADGRVFQLLGDRLRVLPTTPAWTRVQAAILNVNQVLNGGGSRATLMDDGRSLMGFLTMIDGSARALIRALVVACFCARAGGHPARDDAMLSALDALSMGLGFAALDTEGMVWAMERMETSAREYGAEALGALGEAAARRDLTDPALLADLAKADELGMRMQTGLDWNVVAVNAWTSVRERLTRFVVTEESPAASLHEVLCAVRGAGPQRVLALDLKAMTLQQWTSAFLAAAGKPQTVPSADGPPPLWLVGFSLNRLGAACIDGARLADLLTWALGPGASAIDATTTHDMILARKRGGDGFELSNRLALCITTGPEAPMGAWTARPRQGMALVFDPSLLRDVMGPVVQALRLPLLLAAAQGPGVRIAPDPLTQLIAGRPGDRQVWVYRQRFGQMLEPSVIGPQSADEILDYAPTLPGSTP